MRAKFISENILKPNKELFDFFKKTFIDVKNSKTNDPFYELNKVLKPLDIELVDFHDHLMQLSQEERQMLSRASIIPELGIRLMGYDPPTKKIFIAIDETFDNKLIKISPIKLNTLLNRLWSGFGHETIHKEQTKRMNVEQNPEFISPEDYYSNKQEIMAMAFSFVEEMRNFHTDEEIINILRTGKSHPGSPHHPLYNTYKKLGKKEYKLFVKYVYKYLENNEF